METFILILNEIIFPILWGLFGIACLAFMVCNIVKLCKMEVDNTLRLVIKIDDVPDDMGETFKDITCSAFAALLERRNNNDI